MIFLASFCNIFKFKRNANVIIHNLFYPSNDVSVCVVCCQPFGQTTTINRTLFCSGAVKCKSSINLFAISVDFTVRPNNVIHLFAHNRVVYQNHSVYLCAFLCSLQFNFFFFYQCLESVLICKIRKVNITHTHQNRNWIHIVRYTGEIHTIHKHNQQQHNFKKKIGWYFVSFFLWSVSPKSMYFLVFQSANCCAPTQKCAQKWKFRIGNIEQLK